MITTPRRLVYDAHRALGVLKPGQGPSEDAVDDGFRLLNDMLDAWQLERLMVYSIAGTPYTLPSAGGSFTMGPAGTLSLTAPVRVESASWTSPEMCCHTPALLTQDDWRRGLSGIYSDGRYPLTTLYVRPDAKGGETLTLYQWEPLTQFATADSCADLPPGYAQALRWNLACQMYPMAVIQQKIPQSAYAVIEQKAVEAKAAIKSFHSSPPPVLDGSDGGALACHGGGYDICGDCF